MKLTRLYFFILLINSIAYNALCQYPTELNPTEWRWIASSVDGNEHFQQYTHKNKTYFGSSSILVWSRINFALKTRTVKNKRISNKGVYRLELVEYFCDSRQFRTVQGTSYDSKGNIFDEYEKEFGTQLYPIPGSISEVLLNTACKMIGK